MTFSHLCVVDVGGYFETGTLVRYDFLPEAANFALTETKSQAGIGLLSGANLTEEELVFSFSTSSTPSILVYISSRTQDYMAVVVKHNGRPVVSALFWACFSRTANILLAGICVFRHSPDPLQSRGSFRTIHHRSSPA